MISEEHFMRRCLDLARQGLGNVSPNPMVGAVVVYKDTIIGEGFHQKFGEAHAEINAINSVLDLSLLKEATLYVNLEPCAHYGKTPPCAERIIDLGIPEVKIGCVDTYAEVNGKGISMMRDAGINVSVGILEKECLALNSPFFTFYAKKRPYIILKWAETADGFIAHSNYDSKWISNDYSRQLVHQWRHEVDGILVGSNTLRYDNPSLTSRIPGGKNPIRIAILKNGDLSPDANFLDGSTESILFTASTTANYPNITCIQLTFDDHLIENILEELYQRKIQTLMVEGGSNLLQQFIDKQLWDEARIFKAPILFQEGILAPKIILQDPIAQRLADNILQISKRNNQTELRLFQSID